MLIFFFSYFSVSLNDTNFSYIFWLVKLYPYTSYWYENFFHMKAPFLMAQMVKNMPAMPETLVRSLGWKDPLEKVMATHSIFLPGEIHG